MIINADLEVKVFTRDPLIEMIAQATGEFTGFRKIRDGIYEFGQFNYPGRQFGFKDFLSAFGTEDGLLDANGEYFPDYGVCDSYDQILEQCPRIHLDPDRRFVIWLTVVRRDSQPPEGGWRWHKWGTYIGDHQPTTEYLYNEPKIERVYCYQVAEKIESED